MVKRRFKKQHFVTAESKAVEEIESTESTEPAVEPVHPEVNMPSASDDVASEVDSDTAICDDEMKVGIAVPDDSDDKRSQDGRPTDDDGSKTEEGVRDFGDAAQPSDVNADEQAKSALSDENHVVDAFTEVKTMDANAGLGGIYGIEYGLEQQLSEERTIDTDVFSEELPVFPEPEVFNSYPPEVQRKIMEWTDRDVKARRDDESRRRDEIMRAKVERDRWNQIIPALIVILALLCGAVTGIVTKNPLFAIAFLIVPLAVIGARLASGARKSSHRDKYRKPPQ